MKLIGYLLVTSAFCLLLASGGPDCLWRRLRVDGPIEAPTTTSTIPPPTTTSTTPPPTTTSTTPAPTTTSTTPAPTTTSTTSTPTTTTRKPIITVKVVYEPTALQHEITAVELINGFRAKHGSPQLTLRSSSIGGRAFQCAKYYVQLKKIDHSCPDNINPKLGENLFNATAVVILNPDEIAKRAVNMWYDEGSNYDYKNLWRENSVIMFSLVWNFRRLNPGISPSQSWSKHFSIHTAQS